MCKYRNYSVRTTAYSLHTDLTLAGWWVCCMVSCYLAMQFFFFSKSQLISRNSHRVVDFCRHAQCDHLSLRPFSLILLDVRKLLREVNRKYVYRSRVTQNKFSWTKKMFHLSNRTHARVRSDHCSESYAAVWGCFWLSGCWGDRDPVTQRLCSQPVSFPRSAVCDVALHIQLSGCCSIFKSPLISLIHLIFSSNYYSMMAPLSHWQVISCVPNINFNVAP